MNSAMTVLAVDDEAPALDELVYMLQKHPAIGRVRSAADATLALRELHDGGVDAVFLDINMPGLSGLELAAVLSNFAHPPAVVFVTAHDDKAVAAFDVGAVDYLLKPIRSDRLDEAVRRVMATRSLRTGPGCAHRPCPGPRRDSGRVGRDHAPDTTGQHRMGGSRGRLLPAALGIRRPSGADPAEHTRNTLGGCRFPTGAPVVSGVAVDGDRDAHHGRVCDGAASCQRCLAGRGVAGQPSPGA